jgi:hypothetical protein
MKRPVGAGQFKTPKKPSGLKPAWRMASGGMPTIMPAELLRKFFLDNLARPRYNILWT